MGLVSTLLNKAVCFAATTKAVINSEAGALCDGVPSALTAQGIVQGYIENGTSNHVFLGVPYAASTAGNNRWKAPQTPSKSLSYFNATSYGHTCPQASISSTLASQDEDCLNLNIWAPADGTDLPVFVYIYGGAMLTGGSSNAQWQGSNFAEKDVIYVNFNYRESIFGAPNAKELASKTESQNFNILDVEAAIQWVYDNIRAFGGDNSKIVIGGHSSGAVMVDHYLWNNPDTFVAGAIEMSANAQSGPNYAPQNVGIQKIYEAVSNSTGKTINTIDKLRSVSIYDIESSKFNSTYNTWFTPTVDNITRWADLPARYKAGKFPKSIPMIVGNSDQEGKIFQYAYSSEVGNFTSWINTYDADLAFIPDAELFASYNESDYTTESLMSADSYADARFWCATDYLLDLRADTNPTWAYRWFGNYSNVLGVAGIGASHGSEVPFFHGGNQCFELLDDVTDEQQALADYLNDLLVAWIKDPTAGPGWDQATPTSGPLAKLGVPDSELEIVTGETGDYNSRCQNLYKTYYPKYPVVINPTA